jgi:UrcA family protein
MKRFAPATLALAALLAGTPAFATAPTEAPTKTVSYSDLDLAKPADLARLERRISGASRVVCVTSDPILLTRCRNKARIDAQAQMQRAIARAGSAERLASMAGAPVVGN